MYVCWHWQIQIGLRVGDRFRGKGGGVLLVMCVMDVWRFGGRGGWRSTVDGMIYCLGKWLYLAFIYGMRVVRSLIMGGRIRYVLLKDFAVD